MEANIIRYQFNPPALSQGLGFRLFGKPITWRSVLKLAAQKVLDYVGTTLDIMTGSVFHGVIEQGKTRVMTYLATKGLTQKTAQLTVTNTPSEDEYLSAWVDNKLIPFCNNLIQQLSVMEDANATLATKVAALNSVANKIDTVQDHLASYDFYDLTDEGVDNRLAILSIAFQPIYDIIKAYVQQLDLVTYASSFNPQATSFAPLFTSTPLTQVPTEAYKARASATSGSIGTGSSSTPIGSGSTPSAGTTIGSTASGSSTGGTKGKVETDLSVISQNAAAPKATVAAIAANKAAKPVSSGGNTTAWVLGAGVLGILGYLVLKKKNKAGLTGPRRRAKRK